MLDDPDAWRSRKTRGDLKDTARADKSIREFKVKVIMTQHGHMVDNRGARLAVGQQVAYNFSGELAVGTILSITHKGKDHWGRWLGVEIKIERRWPERENYGKSKSRISTVRSPASVMVIFEESQND